MKSRNKQVKIQRYDNVEERVQFSNGLAERVRKAEKKSNITHKELAEMLGVSKDTLTRAFPKQTRKEGTPGSASAYLVFKVAQALNKSPNWMFGFVEPQADPPKEWKLTYNEIELLKIIKTLNLKQQKLLLKIAKDIKETN